MEGRGAVHLGRIHIDTAFEQPLNGGTVAALDSLDQARVADCLERPPERERTVLVMTFYDEQPSEAVGTQLGLSAGNVRVIRHRGIDKLRRCVDAGRRLS